MTVDGLTKSGGCAADVYRWLAEPMPQDVAASIERLASSADVRHVAVLPDVHLAADVCIGTAVATSQLLYPAAIGSDIGCGIAAVKFHSDSDWLSDERAAAGLLARLYQCVPSNRHSKATMPDALPETLTAAPLSDERLEKQKSRDGRVQFGTLGRGNHFIEFQTDQQNQLWLMVHSGSRGMGKAISAFHQRNAVTTHSGLCCLDAETPAGVAYLNDVRWAQAYAAENRRAMISAIAEALAGLVDIEIDASTLVQSDHNHVRRERHFGQWFWVHRKGTQSAQNDEPGIIPGSMGSTSFHVAGRGCEPSLHSSSHGAGRQRSRSEARRTVSARDLQRQMAGIWFDHRAVAALRDEAPSAYKDIHAVMRAQRSLTRIVRELRPRLSYKASGR